MSRCQYLLSFVLIGVITVVVAGCKEETPQLVATAEPTITPPAVSQAAMSPEPTFILKTETFTIGDTIQLGDLHVTVHGVRAGLGEGFWTPEEGHYFVYIDVGFRNAGEESRVVSSLLQMELRDADGFSYSTDLSAGAAAKRSPEGEIAPGGLLRGEIGYQIPITATGLTWHFTGELFVLGQAIFSVGDVAVPSIVSALTPEPADRSESTLPPTSELLTATLTPTNTAAATPSLAAATPSLATAPTPELTPTNTPATPSPATAVVTPTPEPTPPPAPTTLPTPEPSPVAIGTTVEAGGSSYTLNEVMDPAPAGVFGVDAGKRLVALDITQMGISEGSDSYNALYFAVQDADGYVYAAGFAGADIEPRFSSGELARGQIVRGWVTFELPESARLVSVLVEPGVFGTKITIADLAQEQSGDLVSATLPPVPGVSSSPVAIGTTVEAGGSSYTLNEVMDPAPAGVFGVDAGKRLVALDITQMGISEGSDSYNALYFAVQDADGYVYAAGFAGADIEPRFSSGELARGQIVRGWVTFELPESARLVSVLVEPGVFGTKITIADLAQE